MELQQLLNSQQLQIGTPRISNPHVRIVLNK